ncbi:hypothetical protein RRG08_026090 [Elysia crispata]|uniref:Uncharacterized protein n=1 Tax=Elysia crispata TaxID=231223 RepID=A0AAE1D3S6_9GAST|nr:hypothetical protein RRG08_026090 [Elysia crispata]
MNQRRANTGNGPPTPTEHTCLRDAQRDARGDKRVWPKGLVKEATTGNGTLSRHGSLPWPHRRQQPILEVKRMSDRNERKETDKLVRRCEYLNITGDRAEGKDDDEDVTKSVVDLRTTEVTQIMTITAAIVKLPWCRRVDTVHPAIVAGGSRMSSTTHLYTPCDEPR